MFQKFCVRPNISEDFHQGVWFQSMAEVSKAALEQAQ